MLQSASHAEIHNVLGNHHFHAHETNHTSLNQHRHHPRLHHRIFGSRFVSRPRLTILCSARISKPVTDVAIKVELMLPCPCSKQPSSCKPPFTELVSVESAIC